MQLDSSRDEFISQMDQLNIKIRQFQQMVSVELRGEKCCELPPEGQHVRDRGEIMESESVLEDLIDKVNNVDAEVHVLEEEYQNDLLNHDKVCIDLAPIQGENHASSSSVKTPSRDNAQLSTTRDVAGKHCHSKGFSFLPSIGECESSDESTISDDEIIRELSSLCSPGSDISVSSLVSSIISGQDLHISDQFLSALPPLPHFEIPLRKCQLCIDNDANESDSDGTTSNSSDGSCIELDTLQNEYAVGGPSWEAMIAPISGLALEEEEEELMLQGQILLGNDRKANRLITLFDEAERSMGQVTEMLGQPLLTTGTFPTSRNFLVNIPLMFLCKEKKNSLCSICRGSYATKDRCARLPCTHFFHMECILQWLLSQHTCPICRYELPRSSSHG